MSDPISPLPPSPAASELSLEALARANQSLRTALHVTLVMLIVLTGSLFIFFVREISIARRQISELSQVVRDYEKNAVPLMEDFRIKLQEFTKTHTDFGPIYTRYFGTNTVASARSGRPAPAANPSGARLPPAP